MSLHLPHRRALMAATALPAFSLDAYMSEGEKAWWDFTRSDTCLQEDVGPTPADGPNEVIGNVLSSAQWAGQTRDAYLAGQAELVPTGNWTALSDGVLSNQAQSGFKLQNVAGDPAAMGQKTYSGFVVGRTYRISAAWAGSTGDTVKLRVSDAPIAAAGSILDAANTTSSSGAWQFYFKATATTLYFGAVLQRADLAAAEATFSGFTIKEVSRHAGIQTTTSYKPKFQAGGAQFDGLDDNLLTGYTAGSGANFLASKVTVALGGLASVNVIAGAWDGTNGRFFIGINSAGQAFLGVGGSGASGIVGTADLRGATSTIIASAEGGVATLWVNGEVAASGSYSNAPTTSVPLRVGALNNAGTASNYMPGILAAVLAGRDALTDARALQIHNALQ